ncbi:unnamed protein product [Vitrella brassicaformis CCMP3155]|uniref:Cyclin C-terminal domain-containing protein n=1 Tax=Vitrella brassicaformis (strain CCMP3155) TaxID=1169540 RepID=A0A0G4EBP2_VITBC|nr:unnamed protein product [Vitrella brassicaformis CCMP3155]|eukprot:CEL92710.1 unnamed protein product [Vitrella brassicaformis CCMP3155]
MKWPQQRAVLDEMVKRAASMGCRDATLMRAVRLLDVCHADRLIDTNDATQVADACVAACVERLEPHLLMDDMPDDPTHTQAQVVGRVAADSSVCGIECLEKLFTAAGMDTHGRLFSFAKYLMFLSMCDIDLAACDVRLLAATAVYITRKTNQKQIAGGIWSAALVRESSSSEAALESSMTTLRMQRFMWGDTQTTKGILTDAVDKLFASPDRHRVASSRSHTQQEQQHQGGSQEHPVNHLFVGSRGHLPDIVTAARLRATSRRIRAAFTIAELRNRLANSLSRAYGVGINTPQLQLLRFDPSLGMGEVSVCSHANGEVRAIKDEPGYRLTIDPPLPPYQHLYQQHRLQHDPPVYSHIHHFRCQNEWESGNGNYPSTDASLSSFAKRIGRRQVLRRVVGGRLDGLLTQSPHIPVAGCTTTMSWGDGGRRWLVLTDSSHPFVAWIHIEDSFLGDIDDVWVSVLTTEAPVAGAGGAFKHRFPVTTRLARVALGSGVAPYVFDGRVQQQYQQQQQQEDDSDDDDDGSDGDNMADGSGGEDGADGTASLG